MRKQHLVLGFAAAAILSTACASYTEGSAAGDVISTNDAAQSVILHVDNTSPVSMELRTILNGRSQFVGSIQGYDTTSILLDPSMFPTGFLYVQAIPADGRGRAVAGPLTAGKGDKIMFTLFPSLDVSRAVVVR